VEDDGELVAGSARRGGDGGQQRGAAGLEALALTTTKIGVAPDDVVAVHEPLHAHTSGADSRVLVTRGERPGSAREEAVDAGVAVGAGGGLAEAASLQREAGVQSLGEAGAHGLDNRGRGCRARDRGVMSEQPRDLGIALDVRKRERARLGERREQRAAKLAGRDPARNAERVRQRVGGGDLVDDAQGLRAYGGAPAATTGAFMAAMRANTRCARAANAVTSSARAKGRSWRMSAPATNIEPAPASTTARTYRSLSSASSARSRSSKTSAPRALAGGESTVSSATISGAPRRTGSILPRTVLPSRKREPHASYTWRAVRAPSSDAAAPTRTGMGPVWRFS